MASISWENLIPEQSSPLGEGSFSFVFAASWARGPSSEIFTRVAVKVLRASAFPDFDESVHALEGEAAKLSRAGDVNEYVVRFYGLVRGVPQQAWLDIFGLSLAPSLRQRGGMQYAALVMGFVDGGSLYDKLYGGVPWQATTAERMQLLVKIARGLAHLHAGGDKCIVHADVKPQNVLLTDGLSPRIIDFGLSRVLDHNGRSEASAGSRFSGMAAGGTWQYKAPELYRRRTGRSFMGPAPNSTASDVYAFGTLCWEVLSGCHPWSELTPDERREVVLLHEELDMAMLKPDVPPDVRDLLSRMMSSDNTQRPRMALVLTELVQCESAFSCKRKDIFISYRWSEPLLPFVDYIYLKLGEEGYGSWLDRVEMGHDMHAHMERGISEARVVVVLVTPSYAAWRTPENTDNCLFELRTAVRLRKPIIAIIACAGFWRDWVAPSGVRAIPEDHELALSTKLAGSLFVDLGPAAALPWPSPDLAEVRALMHADNAFPLFLRLLRERGVLPQGPGRALAAALPLPPNTTSGLLVGGGGGGGGGGVGGSGISAASVSASSARPSIILRHSLDGKADTADFLDCAGTLALLQTSSLVDPPAVVTPSSTFSSSTELRVRAIMDPNFSEEEIFSSFGRGREGSMLAFARRAIFVEGLALFGGFVRDVVLRGDFHTGADIDFYLPHTPLASSSLSNFSAAVRVSEGLSDWGSGLRPPLRLIEPFFYNDEGILYRAAFHAELADGATRFKIDLVNCRASENKAMRDLESIENSQLTAELNDQYFTVDPDYSCSNLCIVCSAGIPYLLKRLHLGDSSVLLRTVSQDVEDVIKHLARALNPESETRHTMMLARGWTIVPLVEAQPELTSSNFFKALVSSLSIDNYETQKALLLERDITSQAMLEHLAYAVIESALASNEAHKALYARLCVELEFKSRVQWSQNCTSWTGGETSDSSDPSRVPLPSDIKKGSFKAILLHLCQRFFEESSMLFKAEREDFDRCARGEISSEELEAGRHMRFFEQGRAKKTRTMALSFVSHLYLSPPLMYCDAAGTLQSTGSIVNISVIRNCCARLLHSGKVEEVEEEDVVGVCKLLRACGRKLEDEEKVAVGPTAKLFLPVYMDLLSQLSETMRLSFSVRALAKSTVQMQKNAWELTATIPSVVEALISAVQAQDVSLVMAHLSTLQPGAVNHPGRLNGSTALHWAAEKGNTEIMEALLAAGANPLQQNTKYDYPAHYAAKHGKVDALRLLYARAPASLTAAGGGGEAPVFRAVYAPTPLDVRATLACIAALGGDLNARPAGDPRGCTPLIVAVRATKGGSAAERGALAAIWTPVVQEILAQPSVDVRAAWEHHRSVECARDVAIRYGQTGIAALLAVSEAAVATPATTNIV